MKNKNIFLSAIILLLIVNCKSLNKNGAINNRNKKTLIDPVENLKKRLLLYQFYWL